MARAIHVFRTPDRFIAGTVGQPGNRTFYLQAIHDNRVVSVMLEKQQVAVLAERIGALLAEVNRRFGTPLPAQTDVTDLSPLVTPVDAEFRVGTMGLGWDAEAQSVVVELLAVTDGEFDASVILDDAEEGPDAVRVFLSPESAQQFAARVTGRLFTLGMQYWQLGESHYWGHNAIIRVEPFMRHCALAPIRGTGGLAGGILSHDFVEAALMRRAGYHVWLVSDLQGSYEQQPPDLLSELQRDRRWCQGNLQNARLMAEPGLHRVHRFMLGVGAMSYLSAPLWLLFLALGTSLMLLQGQVSDGWAASLGPEETALVVAHDAVNKTILCALLGLTPADIWTIKQGNGGVTVVDYPQGGGGQAVVAAMNLTAHLGGVLDRTAAGAL